MRTTSFLVAALVAASSVAAQQETKRFYYPRHIKRQFTNVTITSDTPEPSSSEELTTSGPQSTRRQDVQGNLGGGLDPPSGDTKVVTVVIDSTVFVPPAAAATPGPSSGNSTNTDETTENQGSTDAAKGSTTDESTKPTVTDKISDPPTGRPILPTSDNSTSDAIISVQPTTTETSSAGITIGPIGIITGSSTEESKTSTTDEANRPTTTDESKGPTTTDEAKTPTTTDESKTPTTTEEPTTTRRGPLDPISSLLSDIVSGVTSVVGNPLQNVTATETETKTPDVTLTLPTVTLPDVTLTTPTVTPPTETTPTPTVTPTIETTPTHSDPPVTVSDSTTTPPPQSTITVDPPPPASNTTEPPPASSTTLTSEQPTVTSSITKPPVPPQSTVTLGPSANVTISNTTVPTPTTFDESTGLVTSIPHLGKTTQSQSWLPTTILVDPTSTTAQGLAPTTATGIPTSFPKAITPETDSGPVPDDTELIQIGLLEGYNYRFVVGDQKVAAQIFNLLPKALAYAGGADLGKIQVKKLIPLDTGVSLGYMTTLSIVTYPKALIEALRIDIKIPASSLYNNPELLLYNFTKQINPSIDITLGLYPDSLVVPSGPGETSAPGTPGGNTDPFNNDNPTGKSQGTTAGIVGGAVVIAAAYGAAMFIIARRYKKKRQSHRRASSISNPSEMQQHSPRSSPALMGGALLSRDFTGYGGVAGGAAGGSAGGVAGGRNSHGSGRSGMGNSARTQYISAPVAAENSLGWN